ncbi:MAG TPA: hypothetical protein VJQ54_00550 [Candidatus Sulfotelmatobacter sp.]|nr:hypothetical protein [Candidatus Sulfotelmatobacter sp.]
MKETLQQTVELILSGDSCLNISIVMEYQRDPVATCGRGALVLACNPAQPIDDG